MVQQLHQHGIASNTKTSYGMVFVVTVSMLHWFAMLVSVLVSAVHQGSA